MAEAFGDVIAELFSAFDLLIVDGGHPGVKRLSAELVERELESSADHEARLSERTRLLEAAGYSDPGSGPRGRDERLSRG